MKYQPPFRDDLPAVDGAQSNNPSAEATYVNGNPQAGIEGSIPPAAAFEAHQRELVHLIGFSGQTPSHGDLEQVRKAIKWMIEAGVITNAGGVPVYEGKDAGGLHKIRPIIAGTNISIDLVENPPGSGRYGLRINSTAASGGGGGGGYPHENVGAGAQIHKGNDGTYDELRTIVGVNGIAVTQQTETITIDGTGLLDGVPGFWIEERLSPGVHGGALVTNVRKERQLNTIVRNTIGASLVGGGIFSIPAGGYYCEWDTDGYNIDACRSFIRNVTDSADLAISRSGNLGATGGSIMNGSALFTISGSKQIKLDVISSHPGGNATDLGLAGNLGPYEMYSWVKLWKMS